MSQPLPARVPPPDPALEISPYTLFRRLQRGEAPLLYDLRADPGVTLRGARPWAERSEPLPADEEVVLLDDGEGLALAEARRRASTPSPAVRALYGGLPLYLACLDPRVVGAERFLDETNPE